MSNAQHLVMPKLGLTMEEGMVSQWLIKPGDRFDAGQIIVAVESDKTVFDVEAPANGVLDEILVQESETVPVGTPIAQWQIEGGAHVGGDDTEQIPADQGTPAPEPQSLEPQPQAVTPSEDVKELTSAQKAMAERVTKAKRDIPHFYLARDVDASAMVAALAQFNAKHTPIVKATLTHFLVAALARALVRVPPMNTVWTESGIRTLPRVSVGLAVHSERGLSSPVVGDIGTLPFEALISRVDALVARARTSSLRADDYGEAAVTLSNAGSRNVRYMSSIIVPGQSAIVGVGSLRNAFRPDAEGRPELFKEMGLVLSADHRIHTGVSALEFLDAFVNEIERPASVIDVVNA